LGTQIQRIVRRTRTRVRHEPYCTVLIEPITVSPSLPPGTVVVYFSIRVEQTETFPGFETRFRTALRGANNKHIRVAVKRRGNGFGPTRDEMMARTNTRVYLGKPTPGVRNHATFNNLDNLIGP